MNFLTLCLPSPIYTPLPLPRKTILPPLPQQGTRIPSPHIRRTYWLTSHSIRRVHLHIVLKKTSYKVFYKIVVVWGQKKLLKKYPPSRMRIVFFSNYKKKQNTIPKIFFYIIFFKLKLLLANLGYEFALMFNIKKIEFPHLILISE